MIFDSKKLSSIISVLKRFLSQTIIDDSLRYVSFRESEVIGRNAYAGVVYYHDFEIEKPFAVPFDMLVKIAPFLAQSKEVDIKVKDDRVHWVFDNCKYRCGIVDVPPSPFKLSEDIDTWELGANFLKVISRAEFAASKDVRQQSLYGIYIADSRVSACDNARIYVERSKALKGIKDLFISREVLTILLDIEREPQAIMVSENQLFLDYSDFVIFTAQVGFKYPNVTQAFERVDSEQCRSEVTGYQSEREKLKQLLGIVDEKLIQSLNVEIEDDKLKLKLFSLVRTDEFELAADVAQTASRCTFRLNPRYFIEGLLKFDKFHVYESCIYFEEKRTKHVVMLMH